MTSDNASLPWAKLPLGIWLAWMILSGLGWPVALLLLCAAFWALSLNVQSLPALIATGLLGGAALALLETAFLVRPAQRRGLLVAAGAVGWTAALALVAAAAALTSVPVVWTIGAYLGGLVQGAVAMLASGPTRSQRGSAWPWLTGLAWAAAVTIAGLLPHAGAEGLLAGGAAVLAFKTAVGWAVVAVFAVLATVLLVGRPGKAETDRHIRYWP